MCMTMIEQALNNGIANASKEKTFIDKLLGKDEVSQVRELMKKKDLTREDLKELMYMLSSNEMKLVNYSSNDRYIMGKFFVWIREVIAIYEGFLDYKEYIEELSQNNEKLNKIALEKDKDSINLKYVLSEESKKTIKNIKAYLDHGVKYVVDIYYNLARTSLSLGGSGFKELLTNRFEVAYPVQNVQAQGVNPKSNFLGFRGGKNN